MILTQQDILDLPKIKRLNIINSVTGIKPANLVGTKNEHGKTNLAIFSSAVHLGSDPALIGLFFRPQHESPKETYLNIQKSGSYTINHVPLNFVKNAHYTSARFPTTVSEFERCGFSPEYINGIEAPFVKESFLKIGMEKVEEITISSNKTILIIGQIRYLSFPDEMMNDEGALNLETIKTAGVSGVDTYYQLEKKAQFPYAHVADVPDFDS